MIFNKLFGNREEKRMKTLLEIIDNQIKDNDPVGITPLFESLKESSDELAIKKRFAAAFEGEIHRIKKDGSFDRDRYMILLEQIRENVING